MSIISLCKLKQLQCPSRCILQLSEVQLEKCSVFTDALGALVYGHSVAVTGCCRQMTENFEDVDLVTTLCVFLCTSCVLLLFHFIFYMCAFPPQALFLSSLWGSCSVSLFLWLFLFFFFFTHPNYILISVFLCCHLGFKFGRCFSLSVMQSGSC